MTIHQSDSGNANNSTPITSLTQNLTKCLESTATMLLNLLNIDCAFIYFMTFPISNGYFS